MKYLIVATFITSSLFCNEDNKTNTPDKSLFQELKAIEELKLLETIKNTLYLIHSQVVEINANFNKQTTE
jgi:hypothetical protein